MKLWLDDVRPMPAGFDVHCYTAQAAINALLDYEVTEISFDHDLGAPEAGTGYDVAKYIEKLAFSGWFQPIKWQIHSANPVGRQNITAAMKNAEKYWLGFDKENFKDATT